MRKGKNYLFLYIFIVVLSACTESPDYELYEGDSLRIAVVGEVPEVKEAQVTFNEVSFEQLSSDEIKSYDAIFMTEENLPQASESKYANIYLDSPIPIFFLSANNHIPFTEEEVIYDESWHWTPGNDYAVGVLKSDKDQQIKSWGFGLYNDEKTEEHIKELYSRIFATIDELNSEN